MKRDLLNQSSKLIEIFYPIVLGAVQAFVILFRKILE